MFQNDLWILLKHLFYLFLNFYSKKTTFKSYYFADDQIQFKPWGCMYQNNVGFNKDFPQGPSSYLTYTRTELLSYYVQYVRYKCTFLSHSYNYTLNRYTRTDVLFSLSSFYMLYIYVILPNTCINKWEVVKIRSIQIHSSSVHLCHLYLPTKGL